MSIPFMDPHCSNLSKRYNEALSQQASLARLLGVSGIVQVRSALAATAMDRLKSDLHKKGQSSMPTIRGNFRCIAWQPSGLPNPLPNS